MSKPATVREGWEEFSTDPKIGLQRAGPIQIQEMRRAFHAGAFHMLMLLLETNYAEGSEDEGAAMIERWRREILAFVATVGTSKEGK